MAARFSAGKKALGVCDICGFTYKLRTLKDVFEKDRNTNIKACSECWSPDHPQLKLGSIRVDDPQALRSPRPDSNQHAASRAIIQPVTTVVAVGRVGQVTVEIT